MMNERIIFEKALDYDDPDRRANYVAAACGKNAELRHRVSELLRSHEHSDAFLQQAAVGVTADLIGEGFLSSQVGPYKLREQIGEGGMGVVYLAEQSKPVRRKVALKIIKPGMATKDVVARFEAERQALAMMDHPNIAKVHDGGATDSGQPYFVMELVQGLPITAYCAEHELSIEARLKLFATVCRAVQHAHHKGIIHRDLKPSNVIVGEIDDVAVPKVIDFGVAKAVSQTLTDETLYTHFSQMVGTPLYMSPEQTGLGVVDIDTRSDVYSLGVLLYELLTDHTPFDSETLKNAGFDEMRRIIREDEPPRPSTMVSTLKGEALSTIAQRRGGDGRKLSDSLAGELDWLVMKALEKDRHLRYESANAFAADIDRFLKQEPIAAGPPSPIYRFRKYTQRNKGRLVTAAAIGAIVLIVAILGIVATVQQHQQLAVVTNHVERNLSSARIAIDAADLVTASRLADQAQLMLANSRPQLPELAEAIDQLQAEVQTRRDDADRYQQFITTAEAALDGSGNNITEKHAALDLFHIMDENQWTVQLETNYLSANQRAKVREVAYELLLSLSRYALRRDHKVEVAVNYLNLAVAFHEPTQAHYWVRASCYRLAGDEQNAERDERLFEATPATSPLDYYFPAESAREEREFERAITGYEAALRIEPGHFNSLRNMAVCLIELDQYADASITLRACLALKPNNQTTLRMATSAFARAGKYDDALAANQRLQDQDPDAFLPFVHECRIREMQGDYCRARMAYDALIELVTTNSRYADKREANTAQAYDQRGLLAYRWMKFEQSLADLDQAIALRPRTMHFHRHRADVLAALGRTDEALAAVARAITLHETADERDDSMLADLMSQQASLLTAADRSDEAIKLLTQAKELAPKSASVLRRFAYFLANCHDQSLRRTDEAVALARQAVELSPDAASQFALAVAELRNGDFSAAIAAAEESLSEQTPGPERSSAYFVLAVAYWQLGNEADTREAYDAGLSWLSDRGAAEDLYGLHSEADASLSTSPQTSAIPVASDAAANNP